MKTPYYLENDHSFLSILVATGRLFKNNRSHRKTTNPYALRSHYESWKGSSDVSFPPVYVHSAEASWLSSSIWFGSCGFKDVACMRPTSLWNSLRLPNSRFPLLQNSGDTRPLWSVFLSDHLVPIWWCPFSRNHWTDWSSRERDIAV